MTVQIAINMQMIKPTLDTVRELLVVYQEAPNPPNLVPLCATIPGADLTPFAAYKKLSAGYGQLVLGPNSLPHIL